MSKDHDIDRGDDESIESFLRPIPPWQYLNAYTDGTPGRGGRRYRCQACTGPYPFECSDPNAARNHYAYYHAATNKTGNRERSASPLQDTFEVLVFDAQGLLRGRETHGESVAEAASRLKHVHTEAE